MNWTVDAWSWGDVACIAAGVTLYQVLKAVALKLWRKYR